MSLSSLQLDAFFEVAKCRSFSTAARNLNVTQSALSQRVLNLEAELGSTLFVREPSGIRMTELGEELLKYCLMRDRLELEFLSRVRSGNNETLSGIVRIAGFSTVTRSVILPALGELVSKNADVQLELMTRELRDLPGLLRSGEADFIVIDQELGRGGMKAHLLGQERNVLIEPVSGTARDVYLDHDVDDETTARFFKLQGQGGVKKPKKLQRSFLDEIYGIIDGVSAGLGKAVVPQHLIEGRKSVRVAEGQKPMLIPVYLHYHEQPFYSRLQTKVIETLVKNVPKYLKHE